MRRQKSMGATTRGAWYDEMAGAVNRTVIISEILDSRTRHLIQVLPSACILEAVSSQMKQRSAMKAI